MIVIDGSSNLNSLRFPAVISMLTAVVQQLDVRPNQTRVGLMYYTGATIIQFNLLAYTVKQVNNLLLLVDTHIK